jgi:hypothetical protein
MTTDLEKAERSATTVRELDNDLGGWGAHRTVTQS